MPAFVSLLRRLGAAGLAVAVLGTLAAPAPAAAEIRILAFGDSLTAGFGLPERKGFVPELEAWLHANGAPDVIVVNAGVSGETRSSFGTNSSAAATPPRASAACTLRRSPTQVGWSKWCRKLVRSATSYGPP